MSNEIESVKSPLSLQVYDRPSRRWLFVLGSDSRRSIARLGERYPGMKFRDAKLSRSLDQVLKSGYWVSLVPHITPYAHIRKALGNDQAKKLLDVLAGAQLPRSVAEVFLALVSYVDDLESEVKDLRDHERHD
jgi:hypothetical protein